MSARDDAVTKVAAMMQIAIGYAGGAGAVPNDEHAKLIAEPVVDAILAAVRETCCKHCGLRIEITASSQSWLHAEGDQQGRHTCAVDPYGFHAEPIGEPCGDHPANPCNGSRGMTVVRRLGVVLKAEERP